MPKSIWSLALVLFLLAPTSEGFATPCDTCDCDPPFNGGQGRRIPPFAHYNPLLSPDGKLLYCDPGFIVNLTNLSIEPVNIKWSICPASLQALEDITWSPYDSDKLAFVALFSMDTLGGSLPRVHRNQLVEYRASTKVYKYITPNDAGPYGTKFMGIIRSYKDYLPWSLLSREGADTLHIGYHNEGSSNLFGGYYVPQTQARISISLPLTDTTVIRRSSDYSMTIHRTGVKTEDYEYFLNDKLISLEPWIERVMSASFSPSKQLMALGVMPRSYKDYEQVWIYRVDDLSAPISKINFQKLHCMYSFWGAEAEFITDSTLAVSMHKDGDISSPLWEIGLDGHIVRQLTFLPTSDVKQTSGSLSSKPSVIRTLSVSSDNAMLNVSLSADPSQVTILNLIGATVWESRAGGSKELAIDVSQLSSGVYFLSVSTSEGQSTERFVIAR